MIMLFHAVFCFKENQSMHPAQLARLKKDSKELEHYVHKLNKKGKTELAYKILRKQNYLNQNILELESNQ